MEEKREGEEEGYREKIAKKKKKREKNSVDWPHEGEKGEQAIDSLLLSCFHTYGEFLMVNSNMKKLHNCKLLFI